MSRRQPAPPASGSVDGALERRFPRRLLLGGGAAVAAVSAIDALRPAEAAAASATGPWVLGGNGGVATDGSNYLGTTNIAPLIFKVGKSTGPVERMRIATSGKVGIGVPAPVARLDVKGADAIAVQGTSSLQDGTGVSGVATSGSGSGVLGQGGFSGVSGYGYPYGGYFKSVGTDGSGVFAVGSYTGVYAAGSTYGVDASGSTAIYGNGTTLGVYGGASATNGPTYGVFGHAPTGVGWAVYADGNAKVTGTLSQAAGASQIDHPLDPDHRWLSHAFVESPDMTSVYHGNVVLGADGAATVALPDYAGALNRDFRYQLTCIGGYAPVYIATEVAGNTFAIAGGKAGLKVSWQVTGIRQDDYARAHPIVVETPKVGDERGTRQYVPTGSKAKAYQPLPAAATANPAVPTAPAAVPAPQR